MVISFAFDTTPLDSVLDRMERNARDLSSPMSDIGARLADDVQGAFDGEREPRGPAWPELAASTLAEKERLGYGGKKKLEREGTLRDSYSVVPTANSADVVSTDTPGKVHAHDKGTTRAGRGNSTTIPQRRAANASEDTLEYAGRRLADHITRP